MACLLQFQTTPYSAHDIRGMTWKTSNIINNTENTSFLKNTIRYYFSTTKLIDKIKTMQIGTTFLDSNLARKVKSSSPNDFLGSHLKNIFTSEDKHLFTKMFKTVKTI